MTYTVYLSLLDFNLIMIHVLWIQILIFWIQILFLLINLFHNVGPYSSLNVKDDKEIMKLTELVVFPFSFTYSAIKDETSMSSMKNASLCFGLTTLLPALVFLTRPKLASRETNVVPPTCSECWWEKDICLIYWGEEKQQQC